MSEAAGAPPHPDAHAHSACFDACLAHWLSDSSGPSASGCTERRLKATHARLCTWVWGLSRGMAQLIPGGRERFRDRARVSSCKDSCSTTSRMGLLRRFLVTVRARACHACAHAAQRPRRRLGQGLCTDPPCAHTRPSRPHASMRIQGRWQALPTSASSENLAAETRAARARVRANGHTRTHMRCKSCRYTLSGGAPAVRGGARPHGLAITRGDMHSTRFTTSAEVCPSATAVAYVHRRRLYLM